MPYALILSGLLLTIAGARGTQGDLFDLLKGDFTGNNSFVWWSVSIVGIGSLGYIAKFRGVANAFLALVFIVLILANKGVFAQFINSLKSGTSPTPTNDNTVAGPLDAAKNALNSVLNIGSKAANIAAIAGA